MTKVLLADDDESILDAVKMILEDQGYNVFSSLNAKNIITNIKEFKPDIIIMDILLSGYDGREIGKKIKSDSKLKKIPVVLISAQPNSAKSALSSGVDDFLPKPFKMDDLLNMVAKYT